MFLCIVRMLALLSKFGCIFIFIPHLFPELFGQMSPDSRRVVVLQVSELTALQDIWCQGEFSMMSFICCTVSLTNHYFFTSLSFSLHLFPQIFSQQQFETSVCLRGLIVVVKQLCVSLLCSVSTWCLRCTINCLLQSLNVPHPVLSLLQLLLFQLMTVFQPTHGNNDHYNLLNIIWEIMHQTTNIL